MQAANNILVRTIHLAPNYLQITNHKWKNSQSTSMHGDVLSGTVADIEMPKSNTNVNLQKRLFGILPSLQHESRVLMEQCSHPQNRT